jgi:hypothetical protein
MLVVDLAGDAFPAAGSDNVAKGDIMFKKAEASSMVG